jgi:hypothetical protein
MDVIDLAGPTHQVGDRSGHPTIVGCIMIPVVERHADARSRVVG